jgi:Tol biopolymer transport system component/DNA-binding winged helix-turn-helix (wHTH) protein
MNLHVSPQRATDDLLTRSNLRLRVGEHVVDVGALRVVTRPELPRLTSKAVAVLIELVRHVGATVTRDQLLDRVWTGRFPTPDVLTQAIKELRRAFADDSRPPKYIETIPKVGYRLIASVLVLDGPAAGIFVEGTALQSLDDESAAVAVDPSPLPISRPARTRSRFIAAAVSLLAVAVVVAATMLGDRWLRPDSASAPTWKVSDAHALTSDPGSEYRPHFSPDGTRIAFSIFDPASQFERLVVRSVEASRNVRLTTTGDAIEGLPVWSPDGTRIAFERLAPNYCEMFVVPSLGGSEREVGKCQDFSANYFDWTPDGKSLVFAERSDPAKDEMALSTWNLENGVKQALAYERSEDDQDLEAHYSPDGRKIAFRRGVSPNSDLYVMAAAGGSVRQVTHITASIRGFTWTSDNRTLVFSSNYKGPPALYAIDVDDGRLQALGISPAQYPDAGRSGDAVVYELTRTQDKLTVMPLDGGKPARVLAPSTGSDHAPVLSPSGDRMVFASDRSGQLQLWLYEWSSGTTSQLTDVADVPVFSPRWSPDGTHIVAVQRTSGGRDLIEIDLATRRQRVISKPGENIMFGDYADAADSYLLALYGSGRKAQLLQVDRPGTPAESRKVLVTGIAYAHVDRATRSVYYTSSLVEGLFRHELDTGADTLVTLNVTARSMNGWQLVGDRIWYWADLGVRTASLREFDPASGQDRLVTKLDILMEDVSFSVTPARDALIFAPVDVEDTDIGMFRLTRSGTH